MAGMNTSGAKPMKMFHADVASRPDAWFCDDDVDHEFALSLKINKVLHHSQSQHQEILLFNNKKYGNVLTLDGSVQCTEWDEFTYQEMITHLPMNCHPDPKQVLVIGGGDGGVVREVLKYSCVEHVTLCEIDEKVLEVCKQFIPSMSGWLNDPRVTVHIQDGFAYVRENVGKFDVIITDSSDPMGPAEDLFRLAFYKNLKDALKPNGVACCQGLTLWFELPTIQSVYSSCRKVFPSVAYAVGNTPSFLGGSTGYVLCGNEPDKDFKIPVRNYNEKELDAMKLRYYSSEVHQSAFVLPRFVKKALAD